MAKKSRLGVVGEGKGREGKGVGGMGTFGVWGMQTVASGIGGQWNPTV